MLHKGSFDITNAVEFFEEIVLPEYDEFKKGSISSRHALLCTIMAYHLYEWANRRKPFSEAHFKARYRSEPSEIMEYFEIANKITNGTKHFRTGIPTSFKPGAFSTGFSYDFDRPVLLIHRDDGTDLVAEHLLDALIEFWRRQLYPDASHPGG